MLSCDSYALTKNTSLDFCMKSCCSPDSEYTSSPSVMDYLTQCQTDHMVNKNKIIAELNRMPLIVLGWVLFSFTTLICICLVIAYWDEIVEWARQRLGNENRNDAGI